MSSSSLFRLGGWSMLLGSLLALLVLLLGNLSFWFLGPLPTLIGPYAMMLSLPLIVLGLPLFYARQARYLGKLGFIGLFLLCAGLIFSVTLYARPAQGLMSYIILTTLLRTIGALCFGIAIIRVDLFPRWVGWALLLGMCSVLANNAIFLLFSNNAAFHPLQSLLSILFGVLVYGSLARLGYHLISTFPPTLENHASSSNTGKGAYSQTM